ncbi:MAG: 6-phosphogluconolactonase [Myxococcota bacterium]
MKCFDSATQAASALALATAAELRHDIETAGRASLVVSGGRTPIPLFSALSEQPLDWSRVSITLADDRWVPATDPDSNEKLVREYLMVGAAASATFVGLVSDETREVDTARARLAGLHRPWSAVLLGMGSDGHFASIFPELEDVQQLLSDDAPELAITRPANAPHDRVTMSLAALRASRLVALFITGVSKRGVFEAAQQADASVAPPIRSLIDGTDLQVYYGAGGA